jgi:chaperonin cofactor prefoldin
LHEIFSAAVQEEAESEMQRLHGRIDGLQTEMAELKTALYSRFGNKIYLEE